MQKVSLHATPRCLNCDRHLCYNQIVGRKPRGKFCSVACFLDSQRKAAQNQRVKGSCIRCGKSFESTPSRARTKFLCSERCRRLWVSERARKRSEREARNRKRYRAQEKEERRKMEAARQATRDRRNKRLAKRRKDDDEHTP